MTLSANPQRSPCFPCPFRMSQNERKGWSTGRKKPRKAGLETISQQAEAGTGGGRGSSASCLVLAIQFGFLGMPEASVWEIPLSATGHVPCFLAPKCWLSPSDSSVQSTETIPSVLRLQRDSKSVP